MNTITTLPDIGERASLARTALTDPGSVPDPYAATLTRFERRATTEDPYLDFAVAQLDAIIAVTDPPDDERELDRCADSLDVLGAHMERIREQFAGEQRHTRAHGHHHGRATASDHVSSALDLVDEAAAVLREIAEEERREAVACEDCRVNGDGCPVHGETFRLTRIAILQAPDSVLGALRRAGLVDEAPTDTCPTCAGSGQRATARSAKGRELERHERSGTPCDDCGGTGRRKEE